MNSNPLFVKHRVNQIAELAQLDSKCGAELDLRTWKQEIQIQHEPYLQGDSFEEWLTIYSKTHQNCAAPLILNPKEDGLEPKAIELCEKNRIENFFFLDLPVPTQIRWLRQGFRKIAIRLSEYEPPESLLSFRNRADWVWVDCFDAKPVATEWVRQAKNWGFRVCLVSPELQKGSFEQIQDFAELYALLSPTDAICTKKPELWTFSGAS